MRTEHLAEAVEHGPVHSASRSFTVPHAAVGQEVVVRAGQAVPQVVVVLELWAVLVDDPVAPPPLGQTRSRSRGSMAAPAAPVRR